MVDWNDLVEGEIRRVQGLCQALIQAYLAWPETFRVGNTQNIIYNDIIDFTNFRIETAASILDLIGLNRVGDALALSRSLLEHYLLLSLMVQGTRYFRLENLENSTPDEFAATLENRRAAVEQAVYEGKKNTPLEVRKYPRAKRHIMYVYEGLKRTGDDDSDFVIPFHYFSFQDFDPVTMRLKHDDYFEYYPPPDDLRAALKGHRATATAMYRHYLSYDALLECLELNGLAGDGVQRRIEAHYTFLGRFLHPTHNAVRDLHLKSNYYAGLPAIGMKENYAPEARLLSLVYVSFLIAGLLEEMCTLVERAPAEYVEQVGTERMRAAVIEATDSVRYFWFLHNEASLYDKFNWCVHHATDEQLEQYGGYEYIPSELIAFNHDVYGNFSSALRGWSNRRCGVYTPPIPGFAGS